MKIAYISYEHPLGISGGGIGTYIGQVASLMASKGHHVEVFTGHRSINETKINDNYQLHIIYSIDILDFRNKVVDKFSERNILIIFDLIESPEYGADALLVKKKFPGLPIVIKLHTPTFLISRLNNYHLSTFSKFRFFFSGLLRGEIVKPYWQYDKRNDPEYQLFKLADGVCSPSKSLKVITNKVWGDKDIIIVPNLFIPPPELLSIKKREKTSLTVTFIGKLEKRKGILDLMDAIPLILDEKVKIEFVFVGTAMASPDKKMRMDIYILDKLKKYTSQLSFMGFVNNDKLYKILEDTDICIFPSTWENFPTVCLEAMSAGKTVIGTDSGGMAEIIDDGRTGFLIPPSSPIKIKELILMLNKKRSILEKIGKNSRKHILDYYNGNLMSKLIEDFYIKIIENNS